MGSLTSRPSVARAPRPVVMRVPVPAPTPVVTTPPPAQSEDSVTETGAGVSSGGSAGASQDGASQGTGNESADNTPSADEANRERNLLSRSRGRLSTIITGFGGILSRETGGASGARKTLLGE